MRFIHPRLPAVLIVLLLIGLAGLPRQVAYGQSSPENPLEVTYVQNLNAQVPLDLVFRDEGGQPVALREALGGKPAVLVFAYYDCPMLCTLVLNGLTEALQAVEFDVGEQFRVVTVSIDPREGPELAAAKKAAYMEAYGRPGAAEGWSFLTGEEQVIASLAEVAGFQYVYDEVTDQFAHPAGIVVLTPDGRIARYFFGIEFSPTDLRLGLVEAADEKIASPVDQFLLLCYAYDPVSGQYSLLIHNVMRIFGGAVALLLGGLVMILIWRERRGQSPPANA